MPNIRLLGDDICSDAMESIITQGYFVIPPEYIDYSINLEEHVGLSHSIDNSLKMGSVHETVSNLFLEALKYPEESLPIVRRMPGEMVNYGYHKPESKSNEFQIHIWSFGRESMRRDIATWLDDDEHLLRAGVMPHMKTQMLLLREYTMRLFDILIPYLYSILLKLPSTMSFSISELSNIVLNGNFNLCANLWLNISSESDSEERVVVTPHADITLLSALFCTEDTDDNNSQLAPLQVKNPLTGEWRSVEAVQGSLVVLPGIFLQWLSQGEISGSVHRVVIKGDRFKSNQKPRLTMPLHIYPDPDQAIPIPAYSLYENTVFARSLAM